MAGKRKQYSSKFKKEVAAELLKEQKTISELASEFGVHRNQILNWSSLQASNSQEYCKKGKSVGAITKMAVHWIISYTKLLSKQLLSSYPNSDLDRTVSTQTQFDQLRN